MTFSQGKLLEISSMLRRNSNNVLCRQLSIHSVAYARLNRRDTRRDRGHKSSFVTSAKRLTLYAEFHCLLTLNEVVLQHFLLS